MKKKQLRRLLLAATLFCTTSIVAFAYDDYDGGGSCSPDWALFGKTNCSYVEGGVLYTRTCKHFFGFTTKCYQSNAVQL